MIKKRLVIPALMATLLAASAASFAQDRYHGDRDNRDSSRYSQRERDRSDDRDNRDNRDNRRDYNRDSYRGDNERRDNERSDGYQARGGGRYGNDGYGGERHWDGAGPSHDLRRGGSLPSRYRNHQYVVNNYREHHLRPPPRGYHWVQTGSDYVLAAVATGIIADLIINN